MSVKIIEDIEDVEMPKLQNDFLPPVVLSVRDSGRSTFAIVINVIFAIASAALCVCDLAVGAPLFLISLALLFVEIAGFVKSKGSVGGFGLTLRKNAYLISAVITLGFAVFSEFFDAYHSYRYFKCYD